VVGCRPTATFRPSTSQVGLSRRGPACWSGCPGDPPKLGDRAHPLPAAGSTRRGPLPRGRVKNRVTEGPASPWRAHLALADDILPGRLTSVRSSLPADHCRETERLADHTLRQPRKKSPPPASRDELLPSSTSSRMLTAFRPETPPTLRNQLTHPPPTQRTQKTSASRDFRQVSRGFIARDSLEFARAEYARFLQASSQFRVPVVVRFRRVESRGSCRGQSFVAGQAARNAVLWRRARRGSHPDRYLVFTRSCLRVVATGRTCSRHPRGRVPGALASFVGPATASSSFRSPSSWRSSCWSRGWAPVTPGVGDADDVVICTPSLCSGRARKKRWLICPPVYGSIAVRWPPRTAIRASALTSVISLPQPFCAVRMRCARRPPRPAPELRPGGSRSAARTLHHRQPGHAPRAPRHRRTMASDRFCAGPLSNRHPPW